MKKYTSIGLSVLALLSIFIFTLLWLLTFNETMKSYRSPLQGLDFPIQTQPGPAQTNKVVIVLINGLGFDNSLVLELPTLERLKRAGANAAVLSTPPTYAQTAAATVISGAEADLNDAPPLDVVRPSGHVLAIDTIFSQAHAAQRQTGLFAGTRWQQLVPDATVTHAYLVDAQTPQADQITVERALPSVRDDTVGLVLVELNQLYLAAEVTHDLDSPFYQQAATEIDARLNEIAGAVNLSKAVVIVVGDHGLLNDGSHGGGEVEVVRQPLVMVGEGVISGQFSDIAQIDIAPTVTALLGLAPPAAAQGRVLTEMVRLNKGDEVSIQLALARQRQTLAEAYTAVINGQPFTPSPEPGAEIILANTAFANGNLNGALQLATLATDNADAQIVAAKSQITRTGRLLRLPVALIVIMAWFSLMWRRRGEHAGSILIATLITLAVYHGLYQLQGNGYSISYFTNLSSLPLDFARRVAISLLIGGGLLLVFLMLTGEAKWTILLGSGYGYSLLVTFVFTLSFLWGFWQNGLTSTTTLPAVGPLYWQVAGALEAMMAAALGLLMPWPIMVVNMVVHFVRRMFSETEAPRQKVLPGFYR